jgi:hypothetical protein
MNLLHHAGHACARRIFPTPWLPILAVLAYLPAGPARSADTPPLIGQAPPGQEAIGRIRGGYFFVDASLKEEYNRLLSRVRTMQADLDDKRISGAEALQELGGLRAKLKRLRDEIEKKKVLVSFGKSHTQRETTTFDLGPERLLYIAADDLRVVGWDRPQVKCVLEKIVIAPDGAPVDDPLRGIKLRHRQGLAPELVGRTPAEEEADERKFLAGPEGRNFNAEQRESRQQLIREIAESHAPYRAFQGKPIDVVEIEGLTYQQGNRWIDFEIRSGNATRIMGGEWQRYASLTVYVPACRSVALGGCGEHLDVRGVHGDLVVCGGGGAGRIRDLYGSLAVYNVPLELIETIHGDVNLQSTITGGPTISLGNGERVVATPAPPVLTCRNVEGDLTVSVMRAELNLEAIAGRIDVKNDFGKTALTVGRPLADKRHRIVSESGRIEVRLAPAARDRMPLCAITNCGIVRVPEEAEEMLHSSSYALKDNSGIMRMWCGALLRHGGPAPSLMGAHHQRDAIEHVLLGDNLLPSLFLFSRSGTVQILYPQ